ncbi:MAG: hypothetical protein KatS3mg014_0119 [Actinomycetota bacterium]|nr:MAG: hypothetical protein KatS3mg014_0119 [Actinomycetota bacterium]
MRAETLVGLALLGVAAFGYRRAILAVALLTARPLRGGGRP